MIDPYAVTNYSRTTAELEEYWMFCIAVAGKKATMIASKLEAFLSHSEANETPFQYVRRLTASGSLLDRLKAVKMGKYGTLEKAYGSSVAPDAPSLETAQPAELEVICGVGPKTARYFILHSRKNANVAVIDTHVLKFLKARGHVVPNGNPTARNYARLENLMLAECEASGMSYADFDLAVWSHYASKDKRPLPTHSALPQLGMAA